MYTHLLSAQFVEYHLRRHIPFYSCQFVPGADSQCRVHRNSRIATIRLGSNGGQHGHLLAPRGNDKTFASASTSQYFGASVS